MVLNHSGNDLKNGNLSTGMGGRFRPELVAGLNRNGWQVYAGICNILAISMNRLNGI
jgi:hypothetical protein